MHAKTKSALTALSVPTDLIAKIGSHGHSLENLRSFSRTQLGTHYTAEESELLATKLKRQPIDEAVVERILASSGSVCAYCGDGVADRPFEIHHIVPYAQTQDNSEENLLLVCPNHHTWIHASNQTVEAQKRKRREWYAIVEVRRAYEARGVPFPTGIIEPIDYGSAPRVLEVLEAIPSPSTAMELSKHALGDRVLQQLTTSRFVLVVGGSGSGKSTLALGVAGRARVEGSSVYRYRAPQAADRRGALGEVLTMLQVLVKPAVLVLDDANTWASAADLLTLKQAAGGASLIATWSGGQVDGVAKGALHTIADRALVTWDALREPLYGTLLENEGDVTSYLSRTRKGDVRGIGMGRMDASLLSLLYRYGATTPSIGQFLYLLRGGADLVQDDLDLLVADGRADHPVVVAAIEQIAGFEQPVTPAAVAEVLAALPTAHGLPGVDAEWVKTVFDGLVERRLMVRVRNAYTTIHRDWALAVIGRALRRPKSKGDAAALLDRELNVTTGSPGRLMILWSWLWSDAVAREHVRSWIHGVPADGWAMLVGNAARAGLVDLGMVASRLHMLVSTKTLGDAFEANEAAIAALVQSATERDWSWLREIGSAIGYSRPAVAARVIQAWPAREAARVLGLTHPDDYQDVSWFVGEAEKHSAEWCEAVGREVDWAAIRASLARTSRGDVAAIDELVEIMNRLRIPMRRSRVKHLAGAMVQAAQGARLTELRFTPIGPGFWLQFFPEHVSELVGALDVAQLANELATAPPRDWEKLVVVGRLAELAGDDFGARLVGAVPVTLVGTAERYAPSAPHEFRVLLWQLAQGDPEVRRAWAERLRTLVATIASSAAHEGENILRAYAAMDGELARAVSTEIGRPLPEGEPRDALTFLERMPESLRAKLERLESSGSDYDVALLFEKE